ncbi:signal transducer and activator of transcription 5B isoform X1 [Diabrotica virgifera virgifera]|uniref:Signal transducer and activator of transcription n=1 Tax=Diabrotica virgifera virgifera TaxID=50390 RepID=A0A6P7FHQ4_DIAVI|nr:signal transducer and activator of transcription 5B isoform X1 [Diabrotica virgifera virgifera]
MALWAKAQQLPPGSLQQIYGDIFPIEVRHYLAQYIEEKFWCDIDPQPDNPQHEQYIASLINSLIKEIENKASVVTDSEYFLTKLKLAEAAKLFRERYSSCPIQLFTHIRNCLAAEMRLVQAAGVDSLTGLPNLMISNSGAEVLQKVNVLRSRTQSTAEDLRKMEQELEAFALQYHECQKITAHLQQMTTQPNAQMPTNNATKLQKQKELLEANLNQKLAALLQLRLALGDKLKETFQLLAQLQTHVLDEELIKWKREQQLAGNGAHFNSTLDSIQEWCESLAELIWLNRQQTKEVERLKQRVPMVDPPVVADVLPHLVQEFTQLLSTLVTSTFIIEKQPPQVMKTNTRFTATVRLLVGGKLNVHMTPPQVKVTIISESQANMLLKNDKLGKSGESSGEILNNTGTMEYQQNSRQLSVSFRNMQLKKIKRAEKKGTESVMDEKFSLLFQSQFSVGGGELMFQVWTLSLPVVVIVHGNQEPHAWATVTWDNAFSEPGRVPFAVPEKVQWNKVAETLSLKFRAATGRGLTEDNLRFLAEKAFRGNYNESTNSMLSWSQFCKEPLSERNFTFWEWFYAIMKLTREHLRGPWVDGAIMGFVRKRQAEEMLSSCVCGTFLLRFSDSELGGITIAWVSDTGEVFSLQPFTSKDFAIRSLADRVADLNHLVYLYPDISKEIPFGKYYTPYQDNPPSANNGYVRPQLVTQIPGFTGGHSSFPNTPHHDPTRDTPSVVSCAGSVATTVNTNMGGPMEYLDQLDDLNVLVNFEMMSYKQ